jgi:hypothetical protein
MKATKLMRALVTTGAVAVVFAGCSSNPPCLTDLAAVESARLAAVAAETKLADAERTKRQLEADIAAEEARKAELEQRKAELQAKLGEMSK